MSDLEIRYWSHGPHYQFRDSIVFLTWRLAFTLPAKLKELFQTLKTAESDKDIKHDIEYLIRQNARLFQLYQEYDLELGKHQNPGFSLNEEALAKIVTGAFHFYAGKKYDLHAYCVMSNHVHLLLRAIQDGQDSFHSIAEIVRSLKSYTAHEINKVLKKKGRLWDDFYFDRIIRDERNYYNVVNYILMNPVAAGLVDSPQKWRDSYFNPAYAWL